MNRDFIAKHWYANIYEQFENQTHDVDFLLKVLKAETDGKPQNILEVACGGGRISIPLAKAGHNVTGFDADEYMLLRCYRRMKGLPNIKCYLADAVKSDWGSGFDVIVMAGNLLINIESDLEYSEAQSLFIRKAAGALKQGGYIYLDFDLHYDPASIFAKLRESSYFVGTDELGTTGKTVSYGSVYDPVTQLCAGTGHTELTANNGETIIYPERWYKHIPTKEQVFAWLDESGFSIRRVYHNYTEKPASEPIDSSTYRMTILAEKS